MRVGSWELRVNLFSLVCASATTAVVYLIARCVGANKTGAVVGAFAIATTTSFWFNAGFAKYYAFSALVVAVTTLSVLLWQERGGVVFLVLAGMLLGASIGVSWQIALVTAAGLVLVVVVRAPRPPLRLVLLAGAVTLVTMIGVCVFILVRAGQDPTVNFGKANSLSRLFELLTTADFGAARTSAGAGALSTGALSYVPVIARDLGLGAIALAVVGAIDTCERRRLDLALFFAVVGLGNLVAIGLVSRLNVTTGFYSSLLRGGQLIGTVIVLGLLAALGATRVLYGLEQWRSNAARAGSRPAPVPGYFTAAATAGLVVAVILPSVVVHYANANHRIPPLADRYASRVLATLPSNSVFLGGWMGVRRPDREPPGSLRRSTGRDRSQRRYPEFRVVPR